MVSVIIPVYNRRNLLMEALESVRAQSFRDFEIIVVDDGSDDLDESFFEGQDDVSYFRIEHCGMAGAVRNFGVKRARGDLIAFLDSDDYWMPNRLACGVKLFETNRDCVLVHTREKWLRGDCVVSQKGQKHRREGDIFSDALLKCIIGPSTVLMKKDIFNELGGFSEVLEVAEDYELWLRLLYFYPVFYVDKELVVKRAGNWEQLSSKYDFIEPFRIEALFDFVSCGRFKGEKLELAKSSLIKKVGIFVNGCNKRGRFKEAASMLDRLKVVCGEV